MPGLPQAGGRTTPQVTGDTADTPATPAAILYGADRIAICKGDVRERAAPAAATPPRRGGHRVAAGARTGCCWGRGAPGSPPLPHMLQTSLLPRSPEKPSLPPNGT